MDLDEQRRLNAEKQARFRARRRAQGLPLYRGVSQRRNDLVRTRLRQLVGPPIDPEDYSHPESDVRKGA